MTPLHYAAKEKLADLARLLINNGANINAVSTSNDTPLHEAFPRSPSKTIIKLLVDNGAELSITDKFGNTPIDKADSEKMKNYLRKLAE